MAGVRAPPGGRASPPGAPPFDATPDALTMAHSAAPRASSPRPARAPRTLRGLRWRALAALAASVATALAVGYGCSASPSSTGGTGGGAPGATSSASASGGGGEAGAGPTSTATGIGPLDGGTGDSSFDEDAACVAESVTTSFIPLDMLILLDRSGSMSGSNWEGASGAIKAFIGDEASAGISVGIVYFPVESPPDKDDCNHLHYVEPVVPIGELPGNAEAITQSIDAAGQSGGTPMYGGLKGALFHVTAHQDANPDRKVILLFASDGEPTGCSGNQTDTAVIAELAAKAHNYNGVQTYAIAIQGADLGVLNAIADAGATGKAYDVTTDVSSFAAKMAEIRARAIGCELKLPSPPNDKDLDPNRVNVKYDPGGPLPAYNVPRADNELDCAGKPGWYYDNPAAPTKVILCPATCQAVKGDQSPKLEILFGCKSDVN